MANNVDAKTKLDEIKAEADKLREDSPELTVKINRAQASAEMAVLKEQLASATKPVEIPVGVSGITKDIAELGAVGLAIDKIKAKADKEAVESDGEGVITRFLTGGKGSNSGGFLGGFLGKLPIVGDQLSSISGLS